MIRDKFLQEENALNFIRLTDCGISISFKLSHQEKAYSAIVQRVSGRVTLSRFLQPENALSPILLTPLGMTIDLREVQKENVLLWII